MKRGRESLLRQPKRRRTASEQPWNDPQEALELYVAPWIKERLRLTCKTTVEYLAQKKSEGKP